MNEVPVRLREQRIEALRPWALAVVDRNTDRYQRLSRSIEPIPARRLVASNAMPLP
jgi:hypothetical protein